MGTKEVKTTTRDASSTGFHGRAVENQGDGRRVLGGSERVVCRDC